MRQCALFVIAQHGMGWDTLLVLVLPPLKSLLKGPPPSLRSITATLVSRFIPKSKLPTVTCVQTNSHRPERPTLLQYSDFQNVVARVHRRRKLLESQKGDTTRIHRRRKLFESTEGGMHPNPQKEEDAQDHRRRKVLDHTKGGSHTSKQMRSLLNAHV